MTLLLYSFLCLGLLALLMLVPFVLLAGAFGSQQAKTLHLRPRPKKRRPTTPLLLVKHKAPKPPAAEGLILSPDPPD